MSIIGELIYTFRNENKITQNALVEMLSYLHPSLERLNAVTLSRWETGKTLPALHKKKILLNFFATRTETDGPTYRMMRERFALLAEATGSVLPGAHPSLLGNFPVVDDKHDSVHRLKESPLQDMLLKHIADIEKSTHPADYCQLSPKQIQLYVQAPSTFAVSYVRNNQYFGHFIMLKVQPEVAEAVARNQKPKYDIDPEKLCTENETGSYVMLALYANNPKVAMRLKTEAYLFLLNNMKTIQKFLIFSTRTGGKIVSKNYGLQLIAEGKNEKYGFKWFGLLSPIEDVLFSDTIVKLIF